MTAKEKVISPPWLLFVWIRQASNCALWKVQENKTDFLSPKTNQMGFFLFLFCSTTFDDFLTVLARNPKLVKQDKGKSRKKDFENKTEIIKRCPRW